MASILKPPAPPPRPPPRPRAGLESGCSSPTGLAFCIALDAAEELKGAYPVFSFGRVGGRPRHVKKIGPVHQAVVPRITGSLAARFTQSCTMRNGPPPHPSRCAARTCRFTAGSTSPAGQNEKKLRARLSSHELR
jgi:hypothetical protein